MHLSPATPADLASLIDAYEQTARAVLELGRTCPPERLDDPTPCPGWSVFDQVAHVESTDAALLGEQVPEVDVSDRAHVRGSMGVLMEQLLESRRGLTMVQLCQRLEQVIERRLAQFRSPEVTEQTPLASPFGMMSAKDLIGLRCFDIWSHEQDIREALGVPGNLDSPAAALSMRTMYASLGRIAVAAGVPVGQGIIVELAPGTDLHPGIRGLGGVTVIEKDGKRRGVPAELSPTEALCTLTLDTRSAGRLIAGRDELDGGDSITWTAMGNHDAAAALLRHFAITP